MQNQTQRGEVTSVKLDSHCVTGSGFDPRLDSRAPGISTVPLVPWVWRDLDFLVGILVNRIAFSLHRFLLDPCWFVFSLEYNWL